MHVVNIFVRYDRDDTMDVKKLKRIIAECGKIKSIKVILYQNRGTENRAVMSHLAYDVVATSHLGLT